MQEEMKKEELEQVSGGGRLGRRGTCWACHKEYGLGDNEYDIHFCHKCRNLSEDELKSLLGDGWGLLPEDIRKMLSKK